MDRRELAPFPPSCAEFPNDNPLLHRGAIWACAEPCGPVVCERPSAEPEAVMAPLHEEAPVEHIEIDTGEAAAAIPGPETPALEGSPEQATDPVPPVLEAEDPLDDLDLEEGIEVVDELKFDDAIDESPRAPAFAQDAASEPSPADDSFALLAHVLEEVTAAAGAGEDALAMLRMLLGRTRLDASAPTDAKVLRDQALAWQGILRGENEDFDACGGAMLDDWSAALVARVLGNPSRADRIKRELRRRGVAAFGIVEQAA